jgi:ribosomal protein S13
MKELREKAFYINTTICNDGIDVDCDGEVIWLSDAEEYIKTEIKIMEDLDEVKKEINKIKNREAQRAWRKRNRDKVKENNAKWNASEHGKEYQREYYKKRR